MRPPLLTPDRTASILRGALLVSPAGPDSAQGGVPAYAARCTPRHGSGSRTTPRRFRRCPCRGRSALRF